MMSGESRLFYRKPDGGYVRPIFRVEKLREIAASSPAGDEGGKAYGLALVILAATFGRIWLERHILSEPKDGFLARALGNEAGSAVVMHRVRDLAEMVLNLLPVRGIEAPLDQVAGGQIESAVAELSVGKLLCRRAMPFRFIWPSGVRGESFDLVITFPNGTDVCVDTKCKFETKPFIASGLRNSLDDARRRNLPKGHPCAVFVKVPQSWCEDQATFSKMEEVIWTFLRGTNRVVVVQVFISVVRLLDNVVHDHEQGWEYVNPVHDFDAARDWRAFGLNRGILPTAHNWQRLVDIVRATP